MTNYFRVFSVPKPKIIDMIQTEISPSSHASLHENGGNDEIDTTALAGHGIISLPWTDLFVQLLFDSLDGYYTSVSGSGAVTINTFGIKVDTAGTANSIALLQKKPQVMAKEWDWSKDQTFEIAVRWRFITSTTGSLWLLVGEYLDLKHFGFRVIDANLYGSVGSGAGNQTVDLGAWGSAGVDCTKRLKVVYTYNVSAEFYVDGVKQGEILTGFPSGTDIYNNLLYVRIENPAVAQQKWAIVSHCAYHQEA